MQDRDVGSNTYNSVHVRMQNAQHLRAATLQTYVVEDTAGTHLLWGTVQTVQLLLLPELLWVL